MGMHRPATRARLAGLVALAALALSACGSSSSTTATDSGTSAPTAPSSPTNSPDPDVTPADGPMLSAAGFSFHAPKGWADATDQAQAGVLLYAAHPTDENPPMITVRHRAHAPSTVTAAANAAAKLLEASGGTDVKILPTTTVDGNDAAHVVAKQTKPGSHYQLDAYYVLTGQDGWVITFATNQYTTPSVRNAMVASVLATCHWTNA